MNRYQLLKQLAARASADRFTCLFIVSYLGADVPDDLLESLLRSVQSPGLTDPIPQFIDLYLERFGRSPDSK